MKDPIVEEVRKARHSHAKKFGHDLGAIVADFQERQKKSGLKYVTFQSKRIQKPNRALPPTGSKSAFKAASLAPVTGRRKASPAPGLRASG
jgi:hypothetical protein